MYFLYRCSECGLYQSSGLVDPFSPAFLALRQEDLTREHQFLQRAHKADAFSQFEELVASRVGRRLAGLRILDFGCGVGGFLDFAKSRGAICSGFDLSPVQAAMAAQNHPDVCVSTGIADYLSRSNHGLSPQLVTMWDVLEHIREPRHVLAEIAAALRPASGWLFVAVPSGSATFLRLVGARLAGRTPYLDLHEHVFFFTPATLHSLLRDAGFEVLASGGVETYRRAGRSGFELVRTIGHRVLRSTRFAPQVFALARVRQG